MTASLKLFGSSMFSAEKAYNFYADDQFVYQTNECVPRKLRQLLVAYVPEDELRAALKLTPIADGSLKVSVSESSFSVSDENGTLGMTVMYDDPRLPILRKDLETCIDIFDSRGHNAVHFQDGQFIHEDFSFALSVNLTTQCWQLLYEFDVENEAAERDNYSNSALLKISLDQTVEACVADLTIQIDKLHDYKASFLCSDEFEALVAAIRARHIGLRFIVSKLGLPASETRKLFHDAEADAIPSLFQRLQDIIEWLPETARNNITDFLRSQPNVSVDDLLKILEQPKTSTTARSL